MSANRKVLCLLRPRAVDDCQQDISFNTDANLTGCICIIAAVLGPCACVGARSALGVSLPWVMISGY